MKHFCNISYNLYFFQPKDFKFEYPDVTKNPEEEKQEKEYLNAIDKAKNNFKRDTGTSGGRRHGLPTFFGL